jgi:hypothetical protein
LKFELILPDAQVFAGESSTSSELGRVLEAGLKANNVEILNASTAVPWSEDFFALQSSRLFGSLSESKRQQVLRNCADSHLSEAYFIESAGMAYGAKMSLLSETQEERIFFSHMAHEEAAHFQRLQPWFPKSCATRGPSSFAALIGQIVGQCSRRSGLFLIQILLEGWGLSFYQALADGSKDSGLSSVFQSILRDETRHYAGGVILLGGADRDLASDEFILDALKRILTMVRIGPQTVALELASAAGGLTDSQFRGVFEDLSAEESASENLKKLRKLVERALPASLVEFCDRESLFETMKIQEMVKFARSMSAPIETATADGFARSTVEALDL